MASPHDPDRRAVVAALATLPWGGAAASARTGDMRQTGPRTLAAWFSRSGNTRVVAGLIHRSLATDLFEIRPAQA